jgi:hypothetical protein
MARSIADYTTLSVLMLLFAVDVCGAFAQQLDAERPADRRSLSSQTADPTAPLMSVALNNKVVLTYRGFDDRGAELTLQPVVPFRAWGVPNVLRVSAPFHAGGPGQSGFGDVVVFDLSVLPRSWATIAFGPVMGLAIGDSSPGSSFSVGPAVGFVKPVTRGLLVGAFNQNRFADDVATSQFQPLLTRQIGNGWSLGLADLQFKYDWQAHEWVNVPLGVSLGKVAQLGKQPVKLSVSTTYNFKDSTGVPQFWATLGLMVLMPSR